MYVSRETPEQTEGRLLHVIAKSECRFYEGLCIRGVHPSRIPCPTCLDALALVRDDQGWSQLVPCTDTSAERFGIFRFHFPSGLDNSGFVEWLATRLKNKFGTGVFVVCGQNSQRGGIFDYNGCPIELKEEVFSEVRALLAGSSKTDRDA